MITSISQNKKDLRKILFLKRKNIKKKTKNYFNVTLFDELRHKINFETITSVASFISINTEISTQFLNEFLLNNGKILCLPIIKNNSENNMKMLKNINIELDTNLIKSEKLKQ